MVIHKLEANCGKGIPPSGSTPKAEMVLTEAPMAGVLGAAMAPAAGEGSGKLPGEPGWIARYAALFSASGRWV